MLAADWHWLVLLLHQAPTSPALYQIHQTISDLLAPSFTSGGRAVLVGDSGCMLVRRPQDPAAPIECLPSVPNSCPQCPGANAAPAHSRGLHQGRRQRLVSGQVLGSERRATGTRAGAV